MRVRSETFIKNLEEAIEEHRKIACPNVDCDDMIISREVIREETSLEIHYWCRNQSCSFHNKRFISKNLPGSDSDSCKEGTGYSNPSAFSKVENRSFSIMASLMMIPTAFFAFVKELLE